MVAGFDSRVEAVRRFNRFYTRQIGVLQEKLLRSPFSLAEARILYEVAHRDQPTATALSGELALDPGYLSRILRGLERRGLIDRRSSEADRRQSLLSLTEEGRQAFATLDERSHGEVGSILGRLSAADQGRLLAAMRTIEDLLGGAPVADETSYLLRPPEPGDMGWVVHRQGALYAQEHGWDERFEALVAAIVASFIQSYDARRERCWIAERHGEIVGSVFLVKESSAVARLRLLYVEPKARGLGIGKRLVQECVRFARVAGYRSLRLWTQSMLAGARRLYEQAGFLLVEEEPHHSFGHDLVGQTWELVLDGAQPATGSAVIVR